MKARTWPGQGRRHRLLVAALTLGLSVSIAACATSSGATQTAQQTVAPGPTFAPSNTPASGGSPTPTITPLPGAANLAGATDICTSPISVSSALPPEIPPYEGQLRLAQSSGGDSEFGYCASASVAAITSFYTSQLPGKGWQNIQTFDNNATRNIIATRGGESLTITVSPDVIQTGDADLLIIVNNQ